MNSQQMIIMANRRQAATEMLQMLMHRNQRDQSLEPKYQRISYKEAEDMVRHIVEGRK